MKKVRMRMAYKMRRQINAERDADVIKNSVKCNEGIRARKNFTLQDLPGRLTYDDFMCKHSAQLAKEAEARMQTRIERALRFMNLEGE